MNSLLHPLLHSLRFALCRWTLLLWLGLGAVAAQAETQLRIDISVPGLSIGLNTPQYPQFVRVPRYPVYYAPQQDANLFFYDGLFWVYQRDNWYSSSWYDGPWYEVRPQRVPVFVLRIPVRYYRNPPSYFRGWQRESPPRWGEHWGQDWERQRPDWDRWNRSAMPAPAPLPSYQRQYSGQRYPKPEQQQLLQDRNYRHQPRDGVVREQVKERALPRKEESRPSRSDKSERKDDRKDDRKDERKDDRKDERKDRGQEKHSDRDKGPKH